MALNDSEPGGDLNLQLDQGEFIDMGTLCGSEFNALATSDTLLGWLLEAWKKIQLSFK